MNETFYRQAIVTAALTQLGPGDVDAYWQSCKVPKPYPKYWCGALVLWAIHQAGVALDIPWTIGLGFCYHLHLTTTPEPGDVMYKDQPWQHHGLVEEWDSVTGALKSIEGDTPGVQCFTHLAPHGVAYYSIKNFLAAMP